MKKIRGSDAPVWLQTIRWIFTPIAYMESAVQEYGDIFSTKIAAGSDNLVFVSNPRAIQQIFNSDRQQFAAAGKLNGILQPLLGDSGIVTIDGERHRKRRQLLMPPFHGASMQSYGELICQLSEKSIGKIPLGQKFSARKLAQEISLQVILEAIFGLHEEPRAQQLKQILTKISDFFASPLASALLFFPWLQRDLGKWTPWGYFLELKTRVDNLLIEEIQYRREHLNLERNDILSLLMSSRYEDGEIMSDRELKDELMTLMFAGHETTATAISWALYWIHRDHQIYEHLMAELRNLPEKADPITISRLPYLSAVGNEALRLYPVGILTFPRLVKERVQLGEYILEPGTVVVGCIYLVHRREDLYPNADKFQPERFLNKQFAPYEFMAFGGGARRCIGEALAQYEMKLSLATILSRHQLSLADRQPEKAQRRGVTLAPAGEVQMYVVD